MPRYDFRCPKHGTFEKTLPMSDAGKPQLCEECGASSLQDLGAKMKTVQRRFPTSWQFTRSEFAPEPQEVLDASPFSKERRQHYLEH